MSSGSEVVTGADVIGAALHLLASRGELDLSDTEQVERELPDLLDRYRADPVTVDQLGARRGGLLSSGLVTTVLTEPLVVAVVATLIGEGVKAGARTAHGRLSRWRAGSRERRLVAALEESAPHVDARHLDWLRGNVAARIEAIGCPPERAAVIADAIATAWIARGRGPAPDGDEPGSGAG
ncbi:hypothetical protein F9278_39060 [Streptomyces phaeolivaceus]|uniref:Uncharacterized protein n=1 Tax=Streptomyces phaeolivaceus TaxID=2653200 RepID=A0A5P8KCY7_9ACTN|nr:hypothetical protein [Streptomyces phaeolivaceus]QFR01194.1 hypothetical protein F9278_39060 [Streptomyces phaeolivaceus]